MENESLISWNRYLYCRNDPFNYIDPDGEFGIWAMLSAIAATGLFAEIANAPASEEDVVPAHGEIYTVLGPATAVATGITIVGLLPGDDNSESDVVVSRWGRGDLKTVILL